MKGLDEANFGLKFSYSLSAAGQGEKSTQVIVKDEVLCRPSRNPEDQLRRAVKRAEQRYVEDERPDVNERIADVA